MTERERLMLAISRSDFMLTELRLYLDTHGNCPNALKMYKKYQAMKEAAVKEYTEKYGAITPDAVDTSCGWTWTKSPWPWEGDC